MEISLNSHREEVRSGKRKQKTGGEEEIGKWKNRSGIGEEEIGNRSPPIKCLEMEKMTADERELVSLYNERMQGLNREYTKCTWENMISMGQDLQCTYNKLRVARQHIDRELEAIFGLCPCCKRRIPIFPTTLQDDKHLGNSGGVMGNVRGNSGKSGGQKSRSINSHGGKSDSEIPPSKKAQVLISAAGLGNYNN